MQPDEIKQWLDLIHSGGDIALLVGLYFAGRIAKSVKDIVKTFNEMHDDIKIIKEKCTMFEELHDYIKARANLDTLRLNRIRGTD